MTEILLTGTLSPYIIISISLLRSGYILYFTNENVTFEIYILRSMALCVFYSLRINCPEFNRYIYNE